MEVDSKKAVLYSIHFHFLPKSFEMQDSLEGEIFENFCSSPQSEGSYFYCKLVEREGRREISFAFAVLAE